MKKNMFRFISLLAATLLLAGCNIKPTNKDDGSEYVRGVTLSQNEYVFSGVNETLSLTATAEMPEGKEFTGKFTWRSSFPGVATVNSEGLVTSVGSGETYISAQAGYKVGVCKITVNGPADPVGELSLSQTSVAIKPNTSVAVKAYLAGDPVTNAATWKSSDETVATVNAGVITGVSEGNATVTVSYSGQTKSCAVTVTEDAVVPFVISLDQSRLDLKINENARLVATTSEPATVTWESTDATIASVNDGLVIALKKGQATITATANGKSAECVVNVTEQEIDPEDDDKVVLVRFFIDYNNIYDEHGDKAPYKQFMWYQNVPLKSCTDPRFLCRRCIPCHRPLRGRALPAVP